MKRWNWLVLAGVLAFWLSPACKDREYFPSDADMDIDTDTDTDTDTDADEDGDGDAETDAEATADGDADTDADGDTDGDTDSDTDADTDTDGDADSDGDADHHSCGNDEDCHAGREWCEGGDCVPCDNSGVSCRIACHSGWNVYVRNGCTPCACAPENDCTSDRDCPTVDGVPGHCYAGAMCWDWCPVEDPSCCFGNICAPAGCPEPPPVGCWIRGCPIGQTCVAGCESSGASCTEGTWIATPDCEGGSCTWE